MNQDITADDIDARILNHTPDAATGQQLDRLTYEYWSFARTVAELIPAGPDKSAWMRQLVDSKRTAIAAIVLGNPHLDVAASVQKLLDAVNQPEPEQTP